MNLAELLREKSASAGSRLWSAVKDAGISIPATILGAPGDLADMAEASYPSMARIDLPNSADFGSRMGANPDSLAFLLGGAVAPVGRGGRLRRMVEQGYSRGFYRGGKSVADGQFYTPDKSAAENFGKRHGPDADVREYAVRLGKSLRFDAEYSADEMADIVREVRKVDARLADELKEVPGDWGGKVPGKMLYQILEANTPDARGVLANAGYDTINAGQEVITLHKRGLVRDAERALFDPDKIDDPSPFAGVFAAPLLGHSGE